MRLIVCMSIALGAAWSVTAATHSAWSEPVPWDVLSAVGGHRLSRPATPATAIGVACAPGGGVRFTVAGKGSNLSTMTLFDCRGSVVRTLRVDAGVVEWDRSDESGHAVSPGVYMARVSGPGTSLSTSFTLPR